MKKYEWLVQELLKTLKTLEPGMPLPGVKVLMAQYGVSQATVDTALKLIVAGGFVQQQPGGRGLYKAADDDFNCDTIDLITSADVPEENVDNRFTSSYFYPTLLTVLNQYLGERRMHLRLTTVPTFSSSEYLLSLIRKLKPQCLVITMLLQYEVSQFLEQSHIRYALLFPDLWHDVPHSILNDNRLISRLRMEHLVKLGHRHIAYVKPGEFWQRDQYQRLLGFYEEMGRWNLVARPEYVLDAGGIGEEVYPRMCALLKEHPEVSAVISGDQHAEAVYQAAADSGRQVGGDLSVIGMDDCPIARYLKPPLTTLRLDINRILDAVMRQLQPNSDGKPIWISPQFIRRESTAPAPGAVVAQSVPAPVARAAN